MDAFMELFERTTAEQPCLLCGSEDAEYTAIYQPPNLGKSLGAPEGKQRYVGYKLCGFCLHSDPKGAAIAAEMIIHRRFGDTSYDPGIEVQ